MRLRRNQKSFSIFANRRFIERLHTFDFDVLWGSNMHSIYVFALANLNFKFWRKSRKSQDCEPVNSIFIKYF